MKTPLILGGRVRIFSEKKIGNYRIEIFDNLNLQKNDIELVEMNSPLKYKQA